MQDAVGRFHRRHHARRAHRNPCLLLNPGNFPLAVDHILGTVRLGQANHLDAGTNHCLQILDAQAAGQVVDPDNRLL